MLNLIYQLKDQKVTKQQTGCSLRINVLKLRRCLIVEDEHVYVNYCSYLSFTPLMLP